MIDKGGEAIILSPKSENERCYVEECVKILNESLTEVQKTRLQNFRTRYWEKNEIKEDKLHFPFEFKIKIAPSKETTVISHPPPGDNTVDDIFTKYLEHLIQKMETKEIGESYIPLRILPIFFKKISKEKGEREYNIFQAAESFDRLLIVGEPGAGKTTSLKQLTEYQAQKKDIIPVFIKLSDFDKDNLFSLIAQGLGQFMDEEMIKHYLKEGKFLILLDGLNEVGADYSNLVSKIKEFAFDPTSGYPKNRYVVTCRTNNYNNEFEERFETMEIQSLSNYLIFKVLKGIFGQEKAKEYYESMDEKVRKFCSNPLMLRMMVKQLKENKGKLIKNRARLFDSFVNSFLWDWERKKRTFASKVDIEIKKSLLSYLAYKMKVGITKENYGKAKEVMKVRFESLKSDNPNLSDTVDTILEELITNNLIKESNYQLEFMHQAIQEYFTALEISKENLPFEKYLFSKDGVEILVFVSGLKDDATDIILKLKDIDLFSAAHCAEAALSVEETVTISLVESLIKKYKDWSIGVSPNTNPVQIAKAIIALKDKFSVPLIKLFEKVYGNQNDGYYWLTIFHQHIGEFKESINELEEFIYRNPTDSLPLIALSSAYLMGGEYSKAITTSKKALKINPSNPIVLGNLVDIFLQLGNIEKAEEYIQEVKEYMDMLPWLRTIYGAIQYSKGEGFIAEAEKELKIAVEGDFNSSSPHLFLARVDINKGNIDVAIAKFKDAIKKEPMNYQLYKELAIVLEAQKEYNEAIRYWQSCLDLNPTADDAEIIDQQIRGLQSIERLLNELTEGIVSIENSATICLNLGLEFVRLPSGDTISNSKQTFYYINKALKFFDKDEHPQEYAKSKLALGIAYTRLPKDDGKPNSEEAITNLKEAIEILNLKDTPDFYAETQFNLGHGYLSLKDEDRTLSLNEAIKSYKESLKVYSPLENPSKYAEAEYNIGFAYSLLFEKNNEELNLKNAIKAYEKSLTIYRKQNYPNYYGQIKLKLGECYMSLSSQSDLKKATDLFQESLEVFEKAKYPGEYAQIQDNLGICFSKLLKGGRKINLEKSIEAFNEVLSIYPKEIFPAEYISIISQLASVYAQLPSGSYRDNLKHSIYLCEEAIEELDKEKFPKEYANIQVNIGNFYFQLPAGNSDLDRRSSLYKSIDAYNKALNIYEKENIDLEAALTKDALGSIYLELLEFDEAKRNFEEALKKCTSNDYPLEHIEIQNHLSSTYAQLAGSYPYDEILNQNIKKCNELLDKYSREENPLEYIQILSNLVFAYSNLLKGDISSNLKEAIKHDMELLNIYSKDDFPLQYMDALVNLGDLYSSLTIGDMEANLKLAIKSYTEAIKVLDKSEYPINYVIVLSDLALTGVSLSTSVQDLNFNDVINICNHFLEIYTKEHCPFEYMQIQFCLGASYINLPSGEFSNNLNMAIEAFRKSLEIAPQNIQARLNIGKAFLLKMEFDKCIQELQDLLLYQNSPIVGEVHTVLGNAYFCLERTDEAKRYFEAVLSLNPDDSQALQNLATVFEKEGKLPKAEECNEKALAINPKDFNAILNLADIYRKQQKEETINQYLKSLEAIHQGKVDRLVTSFYSMRSKLGDMSISFQDKTLIIREKKERISLVRYGLGVAYAMKGELEKAIEEFQKAIQLDQNRVIIRKGIDDLEIYLSSNPSKISAKKALEWLYEKRDSM
ncbi:MAG: tetratricopeptide repeat protein [Candidatus Edwardsbacteria bacterium]